MRWTVKLELTTDDGKTQVSEVGSILRSSSDLQPEEVGLTLEEGRLLLRDIECRLVADQVYAYTMSWRRCPHCGSQQYFKDMRTKCVRTVHEAYRFRGRRIRTCSCLTREGFPEAFFPLGDLIPRRTTPELRYLFAELGARMPYREASTVLRLFGFSAEGTGRMTILRHTAALGQVIDTQRRNAAVQVFDADFSATRGASVSIDDTFVRHCRRDPGRQIKVTAGRIERDGKLAERFAFVASAPRHYPDHFEGILREAQIGPGAEIRVFTDGDDGLRNFVRRWVGSEIVQQLDWFHIGMRIEHLRSAANLPMTYGDFLYRRDALDPLQKRIDRIREALWRGKPWRAMVNLRRLHHDAVRWLRPRRDHGGHARKRIESVISDFARYIRGIRRAVPNFARARAAGQRISTSHVESVMNHLINHRMSKKQQMRWSPEGAHLLLQVRADLLNGTLTDRFRQVHTRFRGPPIYVSARS